VRNWFQILFSTNATCTATNRRTSGGEKFVISLGLLDQGTFTDYNNGTYRGEYRLVNAGIYSLLVTVAVGLCTLNQVDP
jgi:hypothetical protein